MPSKAEYFDALRVGDLSLVRSMIESDPSLVDARDIHGSHAIQVACYARQLAMGEFLAARGAKHDMWTASVLGHEAVVRGWLNEFPGVVNDASMDGFTPLGLAAMLGHGPTVDTLLQYRADPNRPGPALCGARPVHMAVLSGNSRILLSLVRNGAQLAGTTSDGATALHWAAYAGHSGLVHALLSLGAPKDVLNKRGQSALDLAQAAGKRDVVPLLAA
ncbi:MAG: ankyrin repeat domain-containing protein [Chthonomonas sp.]|nr:ankyrin repeat domain-containing protein [Chthonomonas sp.]